MPSLPSDSEKLFKAPALAWEVLQVTDTVIVVLDEEARIQYLNPTCEELTGYEAKELEGEVVFDVLIPEDEREEVQRYWRNLQEGTVGPSHRNSWITKSGDRCYLTWSNAPVETADGHFFVVATGTDLTRQYALEQDIVQVSESERQRIGQELHDTLASDLVAAAMKLDNLRERLAEANLDMSGVRTRLEDIEGSVREASKRARSLSHLLASGDLEPEELPGALSKLVETYEQFSDPEISLMMPAETLSKFIDGTAAGHLYRIAQEAVRNAVHHGDPDHVEVEVEVVCPSELTNGNAGPETGQSQGRQLVLQVHDDGGGIPEEISEDLPTDVRTEGLSEEKNGARPEEMEDGIGLHLMMYRADLIDATLSIESEEGKGTAVQCEVPLN